MVGSSVKPYAIDVLVSTVRNLGSQEPVQFQRDGAFYAVSERCFGKLGYGLSTSEIRDMPENRQSVEIRDSQSILVDSKKGDFSFVKGEERYVRPLILDEDGGGIVTLEDFARTARVLRGLADDGKIRMISHTNSYHSHKHGYAADGTDVDLAAARVLDQKRYFELMRAREDRFFEFLESCRGEVGYLYACSTILNERPADMPDMFIVTPNVMLTLPRSGSIDSHDENRAWNFQTDLGDAHTPHYPEVPTYQKSPFNFSFTFNSRKVIERRTENFSETLAAYQGEVAFSVQEFNNSLPVMEAFIAKMNSAHNVAFADIIGERRKHLSAVK